MSTLILNGDARKLALADESVHLIVFSPPYPNQRSYRTRCPACRGDGCRDCDGRGWVHVKDQIGSEPHPRYWLVNMWEVMRECWRVLAKDGSCFINLGEKRAASGGHNNSNLGATSALSKHAQRQKAGQGSRLDRIPRAQGTSGSMAGSTLEGGKGGMLAKRQADAVHRATRRNAPDRYSQAYFGRPKSRQGIPERFVIGCMDGLADPCVVHEGPHEWRPECEGIGWIYRQLILWRKVNGIPESCDDRTRDDFEFVYHLVKAGDYYSAVDEIREASGPETWGPGSHSQGMAESRDDGYFPMPNNRKTEYARSGFKEAFRNPLGKLPGSVWEIPSEPLNVPDYFIEDDRGWRMWGDKRYGKPRKPKDDVGGLFDSADLPIDLRGAPVVPELVALWQYAERRLAEGYEGPIRVGHVDHFAAYPTALPEKIIRGWSPSAICTVCGEGRRLVVTAMGLDLNRPQSRRAQELVDSYGLTSEHIAAIRSVGVSDTGRGAATQTGTGKNTAAVYKLAAEARKVLGGYSREFLLQRPRSFGYACACTPYTDHAGTGKGERGDQPWGAGSTPGRPRQNQSGGLGNAERVGGWRDYHFAGWTPPPTRPAVVLDVFGGTGTTAVAAEPLGRNTVLVELSPDYCHLSDWRVNRSGHGHKVNRRAWQRRQGTLL